MGRTSLGNILLTPDELTWITFAINRRMKTPELLASDRERGIVSALSIKLDEMVGQLPTRPSDPIVLKSSRNEARYIQRVATGVRDALLLKIAPGYAEKLDKESDEAERRRLTEYRDETIARAKDLDKLIHKIEVAL